MKGTLHKTETGWVVRYDAMQDNYNYPYPIWDYFSLHPDDVKSINDEYWSFIRKSVFDGKEVEFEIVNETYEDGKGCTYAKIINHIADISKMVEDDVKDWAHLTSVSKGLDGSVYQSTYEDGFIDGYNKAKETLYTEE